MPNEIPPAFRAYLDGELAGAVDALVAKAAEYDGQDIIEANVALSNWMLGNFKPRHLAAASAALALRIHRASNG